MNKRIQELIEQATESPVFPANIGYFDKEKFAELIIQECMREIRHKSFELLDIDFYPHYQELLKKHFGVES